ncbi:MAG: c-type cytochrome [Rhodoferax sp.]|jgi:cytochrome c|nr:c-type cytochrome [Rhodoferax sp.]
MFKATLSLIASSAVLTLATLTPAHAAVDAAAAQAVFKDNECTKCHAVDKEKKGPSLKKISAKYKGKADGQAKLIDNFTKGAKVKTDDGKEVDHKILDSKDVAVQKNLADWILSN